MMRHLISRIRPVPLSQRQRPRRLPSARLLSSAGPSVDPNEVAHFDGLASSWWDPQGPSRLLHLMNPLRHDFIRECVGRAGGLDYLDVGCGGGIFAESAARLPDTGSVTGIDPSAAVVAAARAHAARDPLLSAGGRLHYQQTSLERVASADGYDIVTVFEVLEHAASPATLLDCCARLVRPGGWLVASTIARTATSWVVTKLLAEYVLRVVPPGTHDWARYVNEAELRAHLLAAGGCWESPRCKGVVYVPGFGWKFIPGSEQWGNYFFAIRRTGQSSPSTAQKSVQG